jgi:hypothetical protein
MKNALRVAFPLSHFFGHASASYNCCAVPFIAFIFNFATNVKRQNITLAINSSCCMHETVGMPPHSIELYIISNLEAGVHILICLGSSSRRHHARSFITSAPFSGDYWRLS